MTIYLENSVLAIKTSNLQNCVLRVMLRLESPFLRSETDVYTLEPGGANRIHSIRRRSRLVAALE